MVEQRAPTVVEQRAPTVVEQRAKRVISRDHFQRDNIHVVSMPDSSPGGRTGGVALGAAAAGLAIASYSALDHGLDRTL